MTVPLSFRTEQFLESYELLPPVSKRRAYTMSRLAVLKDGTTMPVLRILAREKFEEWDEKEVFPFWVDRDWTNETLENVGLCPVLDKDAKRLASSYGVPAGTKEYSKRWRAANVEKVKASQKAYRLRRADEYRRLRLLASGEPLAEGETSSTTVRIEEPSILSKLAELTREPEGES
jgi:hypothetical protein